MREESPSWTWRGGDREVHEADGTEGGAAWTGYISYTLSTHTTHTKGSAQSMAWVH